MNYAINRNIFLFLTIIAALCFSACERPAADNVRRSREPTPTAAYKLLYNSVKAKNTDDIKSVLSQNTINFAQGNADRQKITFEKLLENGLTATTFSAAMPEIRNERIKDNMGAVEVWNSKDSLWEDLPFINENGGWKLAVGDVFGGNYKSPGKGRAQLESEAKPAPSVMRDVPINANYALPNAPNSAIKPANSK